MVGTPAIPRMPKDLDNYAGEFVVFYSESPEPKVLYSSPLSEKAFAMAKKLQEEMGVAPTVFRVQENPNSIGVVLATRC